MLRYALLYNAYILVCYLCFPLNLFGKKQSLPSISISP